MSWTLTKILQAVFLDFTLEGERVTTQREYAIDEQGRKYLSKKVTCIKETGEVLQEDFYSPSSKHPFATHINRPYTLA